METHGRRLGHDTGRAKLSAAGMAGHVCSLPRSGEKCVRSIVAKVRFAKTGNFAHGPAGRVGKKSLITVADLTPPGGGNPGRVYCGCAAYPDSIDLTPRRRRVGHFRGTNGALFASVGHRFRVRSYLSCRHCQRISLMPGQCEAVAKPLGKKVFAKGKGPPATGAGSPLRNRAGGI